VTEELHVVSEVEELLEVVDTHVAPQLSYAWYPTAIK
jgi:hypothetical protein